MSEMKREEMRSLLRAMVQDEARFDAALETLLELRYEADEVRISERLRENALERMRDAGLPPNAESGLNGKLSGLALIFGKGGHQRARFGLALALAALALIALLLFHRPAPQTPVVRSAPSHEQGNHVPDGHDNTGPNRHDRVVKKPPVPRRAKEARQPIVAARTVVGTVKSVSGWPSVSSRRGGVREQLTKGKVLYADSIIECGDTDKLEATFKDGSRIAMDFNSAIVVPRVVAGMPRPDEIELVRGRLFATIEPATHRAFAVRTPVATAEVLGTEFGLSLEKRAGRQKTGGLTATLQVRKGRVRFSNALGAVVASDQTESKATADTAPTNPKRILVVALIRMTSLHSAMLLTEPTDEREARPRMVYEYGVGGFEAKTLSSGVTITRVELNSPAVKAGFKVGDIVTALDNAPIRRAEHLLRPVYRRPNTRFVITVKRGTWKLKLRLRTGRSSEKVPKLSAQTRRRLEEATWQALVSPTSAAVSRLQQLANRSGSSSAFNNLGVAHLMRDEAGDAVRALHEAVKREPRVALFRRNLGHALQDLGNQDRSVEEFAQAYEIDPRSIQVVRDYAEALWVVGRDQEGLEVLDRFIRLNPRKPEAWLWRARLLLRPHRQEEAMVSIRRAIALEPGYAEAWYELADLFFDEGKWAEAESSARKTIEIDPTKAIYHQLLGVALKNEQLLGEAEQAFRTAIRLDPKLPVAYDALGNVLQDSNRFTEAEVCLRNAIRLAPDYTQPYVDLARLLFHSGKTEDAKRLLERAVEIGPETPELYGTIGGAYYAGRYYKESETAYRKSLEIEPQNATRMNNLGLVIQEQGRVDEAAKLFESAIAIDPTSFTLRRNLTMAYMRLNQLENARAEARTMMRLLPKDGSWHRDYGVLLMQLGLLTESESVMRAGTGLLPNDAILQCHFGNLFFGQNRIEEALAAYQRAVQIDPRLVVAQANSGAALVRLGRYSEAEGAYRKALQLAPTEYQLIAQLADAVFVQGRRDESAAIYLDAIRVVPNDLETMNDLAFTLADRDLLLEKALELANKVVAAAPNIGAGVDTLGFVHFKRNELSEAEALYKKALQLISAKPDAADVWVHLGMVYEKQRDTKQATEAYRKALELVPNHKAATEGLKRLGG